MFQPDDRTLSAAMLQMNQHGLNPGTNAPAPVAQSVADAAPITPAEPTPAELALAAELQTAKEQLASSRKTNKSIRVNQALTDAASAEHIIDPALVSTLLARSIRANDDNTFTVLSDNGVPLLNPDFSGVTLQQHVHSFAAERPYLVFAELRGGAGSRPAERVTFETAPLSTWFGAKSDSRKAAALMRKSPSEYRAKKQQAKEAGLID